MPSRNPICIYCNSAIATTQDHVPPKSFFPKPRPSNLITVPACKSCNQDAGKDEEYFLATFMFSEAGISDVGKKLWDEKLHRMYKKNAGLKKRIARSFQEVELITSGGIFLGQKRLAIKNDVLRSESVVNKIVHGLYYHEYQTNLSSSTEVVSHLLQQPSEISEVEKFAPMLYFGSREWPGIFEYRFNRVAERPENSVWIMRFYGKVVFWAVTGNDDRLFRLT